MFDYILNVFLLLYFGGSAIRYGVNYAPIMGTCLKYDLVRSNIANRGLFAYNQLQNGKVIQYQNWGIHYGFGLNVGDPYKLLVSKKNPNKIDCYNRFVIDGILGIMSLFGLIIRYVF